ncbi:hypothetical protein BJY04DRAFT_147392 [Aspergillus karnatakaensis]|uniref:uncharacterized protein n=1 Tax=Aspergillus karnatakaensis TaxID=1810916 RepID=UPI003CCD55A0
MEYDLLIVVDATGSMTSYLQSLNTSLPQIISISALTGCFSRVGIVVFRDYSCFLDQYLEFSGWLDLTPNHESREQPDLVAFARNIKALGNYTTSEAAKTGLAKSYEVMRPEAETIMLLYTDESPHSAVPLFDSRDAQSERDNLRLTDKFGGDGHHFVDWISAARTLRGGEKKAKVFALLENSMSERDVSYYNFLCETTDGACILLHDASPDTISRASVDVLLTWMGVEKPAVSDDNRVVPGYWSHYVSTDGITKLVNEVDPEVVRFLPLTRNSDHRSTLLGNMMKIPLTPEVMRERLPKKATPAGDPAERWVKDGAYRNVASGHLKRIIMEDVYAIAINPVFGSLWRAVCKDRTFEGRDELVNAFSQAVGKVVDGTKKDVLARWLEESYNFSAEIQATIDDVPEDEKFPCVFLDPTVSFASGSHEEVQDLSRGDLLEISRSCDPRILRRLGRILTQLTYVKDAAEIPEHIVKSNTDEVRTIPLALASTKYGRKFWKILLHTIVPGTQLTVRSAALLAALTIRMGITPLTDIAEQESLGYKDSWNNIEIPETWAISCLTLLLDANAAYLRTKKVEAHAGLLKESDARLFEKLVAFKTLEHNLDTPLTARIPWTPEKATAPIGPLVTCHKCQYPRSVTIMGPSGQCGVCLGNASGTRVDIRASRDATTKSDATWVECNLASCRAQYVIYAVEDLRVRAKCHYCRQKSLVGDKGNCEAAPIVECSKCANRMIWPEEYRPLSFGKSGFVCPPCESGRETSTDIETSARALAIENALSWLIEDSEEPEKLPFTNRSLFHTVSTIGAARFMRSISLFPEVDIHLTQRGKPIRNGDMLVSRLKDLVATRTTATADCSLCFSSFWPSALNAACGRRGCLQQICTDCSTAWYGSNSAGTIINTAALVCPFCRRHPAPRTMAKYGGGIHAVKDLNQAIENKGTWIYAWCLDCASAKEFIERDCARGMPPELRDWRCEGCAEEHAMVNEGANSDAADRVSKIKPCPKCGTMTEKVSGCGHITCPVQDCGAHWCYFCGEEAEDEAEIYGHMSRVHGGIYEGGEYEDEDEDEDEEIYD